MNLNKPDMPPEMPPEILARGPRSLTAETADLTGNSTVLTDGGDVRNLLIRQQEQRDRAAHKAAAMAAEIWCGPAPLKGLNPEEIQAVKDRDYPDAPKCSAIGDRDQKFVNWLWANHPHDAKVRYAYRNIWPEKFTPPDESKRIAPDSDLKSVLENARWAEPVAKPAKRKYVRRAKTETPAATV